MSKHTRGPWVISSQGVGFEVETEDGVDMIAQAQQLRGNRLDHSTRKANARLIAAAPELLDAAQAARAILQACGEWGNPFIAPQVKIIEDAIKKATGGEG